ncbi:hypothetical protein HG536_0D00490 [Torulaspora globosa]|uniref:INO80 complex subunit B-like conserved region domain-containing protein n=1 Tax=Torulaspora globosa TaxID=48254 RepID=A0A7G3ZG91_9SACH|nr:uncharacterized protein HG536_0D00490 [Torulaspora globosa]QLL32527.1 hypothetical protein HG536_0D00490 [Torulaspora globosa]
MAADSELSEFESETSVVSEKVDEYDEEMANENMNADDDEYVEEFMEVRPSKPKRGGLKRKPGRRAKRLANDDDDDDFERVHPARKRTKTARALQLEDHEEDDVEAPSADVEFDDEEPLEATEPADQVEDDEELSDAASTRVPSTQAEEDDETREATEDSLKRPSKSKMLQELLGDSHSRRSLTEEEAQLRRAENARKRKNLSEKRLEEEKQETINKLLRRRAGKSRSHLPKEDEPEVGNNDSTVFAKPRRPYDSTGMTRTLRRVDGDLYCTVADRQPEPAAS